MLLLPHLLSFAYPLNITSRWRISSKLGVTTSGVGNRKQSKNSLHLPSGAIIAAVHVLAPSAYKIPNREQKCVRLAAGQEEDKQGVTLIGSFLLFRGSTSLESSQ